MTTRTTVTLALAVLASSAIPEARAVDTVIHACVKNLGGGLRIIQPGETCSHSETALDWNIQGPQGPPGQQGPPGPPASVSTSCSGDVASVTTCPTPETCVTNSYPCTPYKCDSETDTCRTSCISNSDCGQGGQCDTATGKCASMSTTCFEPFTLQNADGSIESCIPYECKGGSCQQQCVSTNDCYTDYTCSQGRCVPN